MTEYRTEHSIDEERTMTEPHTHPPEVGQHAPSRGGHGWMMIACCIPMLAIAVLLVATGVVNPGFLIFAVGCTVMMALMMRGMNHGGGQPGHDHGSIQAPGRQEDR